MKMFVTPRLGLVAVVSLLMACASGRKETSEVPETDDLLELLTGFGESLSKRNFERAVEYMVPEERALMLEGGTVPSEKQRMLMALPLQKLIRHPAVRVENGRIAGIYTVLPNLNQAGSSDLAAEEPAIEEEGMAAGTPAGEAEAVATEEAEVAAAPETPQADPLLKETVNKFFTAVNNRNWSGALALINEGERKLLVDDKGRLKESAKQRLSQIDQQNRGALVLQDGKLTGVTLLLPSDL
jgi:hypothetical protein